MLDAKGAKPLGHLGIGGQGEQGWVPIVNQLFVGRECVGVSDDKRLIVDHPEISRIHFELRLDVVAYNAFVIDMSTNGTFVNGKRIEPSVPWPIKSGDQIRVGDQVLAFRSDRFTSIVEVPMGDGTQARIDEAPLVMVVGDITNYSTISQTTDHRVIAQALHVLWGDLHRVLDAHGGTLSHYAGDALYGIWELEANPDANVLAVDFALAADERLQQISAGLPLRSPDGAPIQMGWGVVQGVAAVAPMTRSKPVVLGDATNVAFRLAGIAGRDGRHPVMVTAAVRDAVRDAFVWGPAEEVPIKGRLGMENVVPVIARRP